MKRRVPSPWRRAKATQGKAELVGPLQVDYGSAGGLAASESSLLLLAGEVGDAKDWKEAFRRAVEAKDLGEKFESQNQKPGVKFHRKRLVRKVGKGTQERKFVIKVSHHPNKEDLRLRELETFDGLINSGNIITHHGHIVRKNERSTTVYLWLENWKCNLEEARGKLEDGSLHPLVVLRDVTTGLVNLSKNYTVHRDIRPQSVLICGDSKGLLCAKIGEFDLAKQKSEKGYSKHSGSGTDDWKAPDKRVTVSTMYKVN
eukprot:m.188586 g.188586  ORF g.188586 m.188586 type:complete len:258 (+) comp39389_c0_seq2:83-856(+)